MKILLHFCNFTPSSPPTSILPRQLQFFLKADLPLHCRVGSGSDPTLHWRLCKILLISETANLARTDHAILLRSDRPCHCCEQWILGVPMRSSHRPALYRSDLKLFHAKREISSKPLGTHSYLHQAWIMTDLEKIQVCMMNQEMAIFIVKMSEMCFPSCSTKALIRWYSF